MGNSKGRSTTGRLLSYLIPHRRAMLRGIVLLLLTNAFEKAIPWVLKDGLDAFSGQATGDVAQAAIWVVALASGMMVTRVLSRLTLFFVGRRIEFQIRGQLLAALHRLGASFHARMPTGDIMSRATNDVGQVRLLLGFGMLNMVNALVAYLSAFGLMLVISPWLTLFAMLPYPFFVIATRFFSRSLYGRSRAQQSSLGALSARAQEYLAGVRVVRAFAVDDFERGRFEEANQRAVKASMDLVKLRALMMPVLLMLSSAATVLGIWKGGELVNAGELTKGELLAFYAYLAQLVWPTMAFGYMLSILQRGRAAYDRITEVLDAVPDVVEIDQPRPLPPAAPLGGRLQVRGLHFSRDGREVLRGVDLDLAPGETLAIVGRTGSGKSTLASLLCRLLDTPRGTVRVDGVDVTDLALEDARTAVALARQEPFLFSTTVARNIAFALDESDPEKVSRAVGDAAQRAGVHEDIQAMPGGYETVVGERGVQLSGGQKQRVALARSLLANPRVLVLDDPLSAVDAATEEHILDELQNSEMGRSLVIVTHRTSVAARADRVLVLEDGQVVEQGKHDALVLEGGLYASLAARQRLEAELEVL